MFLRGVNVGGHRRFRPSVLARELVDFDVVNVGAAGTFVVRRPGSLAAFRRRLRETLPFETAVITCAGSDLLALETRNPFGRRAPQSGVVRFVSVMPRATRARVAPVRLPAVGKWLVRILGSDGRFVLGEYRRDMKTIGYLSQLDRMSGVHGTMRNWNTITTILRILKTEADRPTSAAPTRKDRLPLRPRSAPARKAPGPARGGRG
ncbi:MAG: hypothetical protein ACRENU_04680 [Gemmatimonadaceae bacterium]